MTKYLILIFLAFFSLCITSQENYNNKNMVVSMADLENNTFKQDTTANAFFIYEKGFSRVENGGGYNLLTNYQAKVKILNEQGFKKATIEILLYRNNRKKEWLQDLTAYTHNIENGKIIKTKIDKDHIYREKYNDNYTLVKFTFPNLKSGSVLTYKYQIESPFIYNFNGWDFQDDIPKLYSEYIADLPGNYVYNIRLNGILKLDTNDSSIIKECLEIGGASADCSHNIYAMSNIPAFKEESYMTAKKNYFSRIEYELKEFKGFDGTNIKYTETWKNVDNKLKKEPSIGLQLKKINITKDVLPTSIQSTPQVLDKAKAIYRHIANNYTWNKKYRIFKDGNIKKTIENKTGNVSSINILLHNTLKQQGFNVLPVLLSTRRNGYATRLHPVITDFNYLIVQLSIDDKIFLLDATEKVLSFGELPFRCLNQYGRLLDFKNGSSWIDIKNKQHSSFTFREKIQLNSKLELTGKAKHVFAGYHAYNKRKKLNKVNKEKYIQEIKNSYSEVSINDLILKNENDFETAFRQEFDFVRNTEEIDNLIYIKPFTKPFFSKNPFKLNERTYPVDFGYKDSYTYLVSLEIPEGYEFENIPKDLSYAIPDKLGRTSIRFQKNGNTLIMTHRVIFNTSYYSPKYYASLKEFFNLIIDMENNYFITIKKIS
ncbi:DUF3857 domain-containing protein [Aquimarina sp. 2201CG5-10]|uniref:DUF3857 domain-containing protein n=1 Tax=Aquimarina callyspongiae TaxID=3098150 RepID=UPI002AB44E49|nr:DUF3857 domain-containing protein [Aquimarina sp. 2201CG5-10]MDY8138255.1 DUF3857 domain-containing protein [Aquimarina sp. 2201CG5-10]